jgi:peroxiredoxin
MNQFLKSSFISAFPLLGFAVFVNSTLIIFNQGLDMGTAGRLISGLTIAVFFGGLFLVSQARTSSMLLPYSSIIGVGTLCGLTSIQEDYTQAILSILMATGWFFYLTWYSKFENRNTEVLKLKNRIPEFNLETTTGNKISNDRFLGKPTIYLFYRGNWCPLCMAQIKEIANQYKQLDYLGVQMVFISPQPHSQTEKLAAKFDLGFHYLQDTGNQVAKKLGILSEAGIPLGFQVLGYDSETVMPTVIITDKNGIIHFVDLTDNYRVRPEPETFLEVIHRMP